MYNLSHAYIYEYQDEKLINKSIELLITSSILRFKPSTELLCLILLKKIFNKHKYENKRISIDIIKAELIKFIKDANELAYSIINIIQKQQLFDQLIFEYYYKQYELIEFIYDMNRNPVCIKYLYKGDIKLNAFSEKYNITIDFYEGFGHDIYEKK